MAGGAERQRLRRQRARLGIRVLQVEASTIDLADVLERRGLLSHQDAANDDKVVEAAERLVASILARIVARNA